MSNKENNIEELLGKWNSGELSDEGFKTAVGEAEYAKYKSILNTVDNWTPSLTDEQFDSKLMANQEKKEKQVMLNPRFYFAIAASIALLIGISIFFFDGSTSVTNDYGQMSEVVLPDGKSKVILSPHSTISWNEEDWKKGQRSVALVGKAHFIVEKGDPFIVNTTIGSVEVLGTTFDVAEYGETLDVACYTGHVQSKIGDDQYLQIVAPRRATYSNGKWSKVTIVSELTPTWVGAQTKYTNAPLTIVMNDLVARYNIKIENLIKHKDRKFTGTIPNDNLDNCLKLILIPLNIKYQITEDTVYLLD